MVFSPITLPILTAEIILIISIFIFITVILLLIVLRAQINWIIKLILIIGSSLIYVGTYQGMVNFTGWPTELKLPNKFQIHWTHIREPDKFTKAEGAIYLWVEELDQYNVPSGIPRAYKLPYTPPLEDAITLVHTNIEQGIDQAAEVQELNDEEIALYNERNRENTLKSKDQEFLGYRMFQSISGVYQITFGDIPETELPDKSPF